LKIPKIASVRPYLFAGGIVAVWIAGKVAFAGLGAGTFKITTWELASVVIIGAALIVIGWQRSARPNANLENQLSEEKSTEDEP
jgi:hypothetical protein